MPAAPGKLPDRVVRYLVGYIRKNRLRSGAEIPSEIRLSGELKVSRGIVREAYRSLQTAGVLEIANGRSPRVGRLNNRAFIQFLQHALSTEQASQDQVFDVRSSIEVRAAEVAAQKRTDEDAEALKHEAAIMRTAGRQRERFVKADIRFHEIIGRATGNPLFRLLSGALRESLSVTIRAGFDSRHTRAEIDRVAQIHAGLADAIAVRDAARARDLMILHFDEARVFVLQHSADRLRKNRRRGVRSAPRTTSPRVRRPRSPSSH
jgi:GntR family transcriptional regulator, transcriptional repressor for pyruvate dehydrogenase complex